MDIDNLLIFVASGYDPRITPRIARWIGHQRVYQDFIRSRQRPLETRSALVVALSDLWDEPDSPFDVDECNAAMDAFMPPGCSVQTHCPYCLAERDLDAQPHTCDLLQQPGQAG
jgi:hypothetical protein